MMVFAHQQGRFVSHCARFFYCAFDGCRVMTVDVANNVPAVSFETHCGVVGEPAFNVTINRDTVVIVERNQFTPASAYPPESKLRGEMPSIMQPSPMKA